MSAPNDTALPPLKPWTEADSRAALQGIGDRTSTGDLVITIEQREDQLCDALQALAERRGVELPYMPSSCIAFRLLAYGTITSATGHKATVSGGNTKDQQSPA